MPAPRRTAETAQSSGGVSTPLLVSLVAGIGLFFWWRWRKNQEEEKGKGSRSAFKFPSSQASSGRRPGRALGRGAGR